MGFALQTIWFPADFLHSTFDLPPPEFVEIDVDGNETRNSKMKTRNIYGTYKVPDN